MGVREGLVKNTCNAVWERCASQSGIGECVVSDMREVGRERHASQAGCFLKRVVSNAGDAIWDREAAASLGRRILDERGLIRVKKDPAYTDKGGILRGYRYRCKELAEFERPISDAGHAFGDRHTGKAAMSVTGRPLIVPGMTSGPLPVAENPVMMRPPLPSEVVVNWIFAN